MPSEIDADIVAQIVRFAHRAGAIVVAEGIERADQIAPLVHLGIDAIQGFGIARPITVEDVEQHFSTLIQPRWSAELTYG